MTKAQLTEKNRDLEVEIAGLRTELARVREQLAWATEMGCKAIENLTGWQTAYYRDVPFAKKPEAGQ